MTYHSQFNILTFPIKSPQMPAVHNENHIRLVDFILNRKEEIADEWVEYATNNIHATLGMTDVGIRDHVIQILEYIAQDMESPQSGAEQKAKSRGKRTPDFLADKPARHHGEQRVDAGFDIVELSSEFRALRASVLRLWEDYHGKDFSDREMKEIIRFNEAIDEVWVHSLTKFHHKVNESKNWFMGVLGHDLRNPLNLISGVQQLLLESGNLNPEEKDLIKRSEASVRRMNELINNLLQLTKLRLGSGMNIDRSETNLAEECHHVVQEFRLIHPDTNFKLKNSKSVTGHWDNMRINQIITNLITNAMRHGQSGGPITITIHESGKHAILKVHNFGRPIPERICEFINADHFENDHHLADNGVEHGLGLYIIKEIIKGHDGEVAVESLEDAGTTFTVRLPREPDETAFSDRQ